MGNPLLELPTVAQKSVDLKGRYQKTSIEQRRDKPTLQLFYYFSFFEDIFRDHRTLPGKKKNIKHLHLANAAVWGFGQNCDEK